MHTLFKWLVITVSALVLFLIVLLSLGYLLKENEVKTTQLKAKFEQESFQRQEKENRKKSFIYSPQAPLNSAEKSQKKIIENNLSCQSNDQCFVVHTHSQVIGCIVTLNAKGTAILLKISSENENKSSASSCYKEYQNTNKILAQCKNNICSL